MNVKDGLFRLSNGRGHQRHHCSRYRAAIVLSVEGVKAGPEDASAHDAGDEEAALPDKPARRRVHRLVQAALEFTCSVQHKVWHTIAWPLPAVRRQGGSL